MSTERPVTVTRYSCLAAIIGTSLCRDIASLFCGPWPLIARWKTFAVVIFNRGFNKADLAWK